MVLSRRRVSPHDEHALGAAHYITMIGVRLTILAPRRRHR
jgi:hypothetical protein